MTLDDVGDQLSLTYSLIYPNEHTRQISDNEITYFLPSGVLEILHLLDMYLLTWTPTPNCNFLTTTAFPENKVVVDSNQALHQCYRWSLGGDDT